MTTEELEELVASLHQKILAQDEQISELKRKELARQKVEAAEAAKKEYRKGVPTDRVPRTCYFGPGEGDTEEAYAKFREYMWEQNRDPGPWLAMGAESVELLHSSIESRPHG